MTGQAGKVARGLRTIGANIVQLAQDSKEFEITVNGATKTIQLWNETGTDMLDTYDVLKQIADVWDEMSNAEKSSLAITLAKKTQMDTFLAVLGNFEDAEKAYVTALTSEGSAWKENEAYMESIEAHQAKLKQQWEQLVLSAPIKDFEKAILDAGTAILKFINSDIGQLVVKMTALIAVVGLLTVAFSHLGAAILSAEAGTFLASIRMLIAGTTTLSAVVNTLTASLLANPLFWGAAVVAGIYAIVKVVDALTVSYEEATKALDEHTQAYNQAQSQIEQYKQSIQDIQQQLEALEEKKLELTSDKDIKNLNQQSNELERQLAILQRQLAVAKAKAEVESKAQVKAAEEAYNATTKTEKTTVVGYGQIGGKGGTIGTRFEGDIKALQKLQQEIANTNKEIQELSSNEEQNKDKIDELTKQNEIAVKAYDALYEEATGFAETTSTIVEALGEEVEAYKGSENTLGGLLDSFKDFVGWKTDATDITNNFTEAEEEETDAVEESKNIWDDYIDSIEGIQSAYETLTKATDEYNKNGYISASTLKKLNKLAPEHLALLTKEGDTYTNIKEGLEGYLDTEKKDALMKVELARQIAIVQACQDKLAESSTEAKDEIKGVGDTAVEVTPQMAELARTTTQAAIGMMAVKNAGKMDENFKAQLDDINSYFDGLAESINKVSLGAADSSKSAAGASKDAWVEAFEEEQRLLKHSLEMNEITEYEYYQKLIDLNEKYFGEISGKHKQYLKEYQENEEEIYKGLKSVYDKVASYLKEAIEQGYEDAINALKKEEKRVLDEIKAQIEALKDEKQKVLQDITDQINNLKKKKDKVQEYWNSQIDKIKESNEQLQKQNELLEKQQALQRAKAQKVMVMKGGKFQLSENESAVAQAEQSLAEYEDQTSYEQQISEMEKLRDKQIETIDDRIEKLEEYKDYMERYYDEQIDALEKHRDAVEKEYEKQIEALQEELDAFKKGAEQQEKIEEARLAAQVLGINSEAELFKISLENAKKYVDAYNNIMKAKGALDSKGKFQAGEGGGSASADFQQAQTPSMSSNVGNVSTQLRASGDASFRNDEVALVGESPNAELVLGANLNRSVNSGTLVHLAKGSGVVNAESTATLAGLLNSIEPQKNNSLGRSVQQVFSFSNLTLPNVTDANSFVNALSNKFNNYAIQYGNLRQ